MSGEAQAQHTLGQTLFTRAMGTVHSELWTGLTLDDVKIKNESSATVTHPQN